MPLPLLLSQKPCHIARDQVHFHVHIAARLCPAPSGNLKRGWNEVNSEDWAGNFVDGQRYAVQRHRTLGRDILGERFGRTQLENLREPGWRNAQNRGDAIDMARDDMSSKLVARAKRAFEIDLASLPPAAKGRLAER